MTQNVIGYCNLSLVSPGRFIFRDIRTINIVFMTIINQVAINGKLDLLLIKLN